jgi:hypothetical protein
MQSTSSTNFTTVHALNKNTNYVQMKDRGKESTGMKCQWGIEMNDAHSMYLKTYGAVDTMDPQIRRCTMFYRSFKYWHAAKTHALARLL